MPLLVLPSDPQQLVAPEANVPNEGAVEQDAAQYAYACPVLRFATAHPFVWLQLNTQSDEPCVVGFSVTVKVSSSSLSDNTSAPPGVKDAPPGQTSVPIKSTS